MGNNDWIKNWIKKILGSTSITLGLDHILVRDSGLDRKIEFMREDTFAASADNLEKIGDAEGQDFYSCIHIAGDNTSGKVWREATVYTSGPSKTHPLRLSFYKPRK